MRQQRDNAIRPRRGEDRSSPPAGINAAPPARRLPPFFADGLYLNTALAAGLLWLALRAA